MGTFLCTTNTDMQEDKLGSKHFEEGKHLAHWVSNKSDKYPWQTLLIKHMQCLCSIRACSRQFTTLSDSNLCVSTMIIHLCFTVRKLRQREVKSPAQVRVTTLKPGHPQDNFPGYSVSASSPLCRKIWMTVKGRKGSLECSCLTQPLPQISIIHFSRSLFN